jgi:asparagine synthetase B (glutamine-hydrolysing)
MTHVPFGMLLSRGLDSSLMDVITSQHLNEIEATNVWGALLHTFFVNLKAMIDLDLYLKALSMIPT